MRRLLPLCLLLCLFAPARAQTAPAAGPGRRVTVNLKKGEAVSGRFLRADAETVHVEVDGEQVALALEGVASLVFAPAAGVSDAARAVRALNSLAEKAGSVADHREYVNRFLEVRAVVGDQLPHIPEGELREAVSEALRAFEVAAEVWEAAAQTKPADETAKMTRDALDTTLNDARKRLRRAEALLKRP